MQLIFFQKLKYYFNRATPSIKILGISHFILGISVRFCKYVHLNCIANFLEKKHTGNILNYIHVNIAPHIKLAEPNIHDIQELPIIWICWLQGIESAPKLITSTINSILSNSLGYQVRLIDSNNLNDYLTLPTHIVNKCKSKDAGRIQHFTDLIRFGLIAKYGGIWMDSNILVTKPIDTQFGELDFYSCHPRNVGKWHVGLIGGRNSILFQTVFEMMIYYWEKHDCLIDYFLTDRLIQYCYINYPVITSVINSCPNNNPDIQWFISHRDTKFDKDMFSKILSRNYCFKLTTKVKMGEKTGTYSEHLIAKYIDS